VKENPRIWSIPLFVVFCTPVNCDGPPETQRSKSNHHHYYISLETRRIRGCSIPLSGESNPSFQVNRKKETTKINGSIRGRVL